MSARHLDASRRTAGKRHSRRSSARATAALLAALLIAGPMACGKKGAPGAVEGYESEFTWPRIYPSPRSVLPPESATAEPPAGASTRVARPTLAPLPEPANDSLSPFPKKRSKTRSY